MPTCIADLFFVSAADVDDVSSHFIIACVTASRRDELPLVRSSLIWSMRLESPFRRKWFSDAGVFLTVLDRWLLGRFDLTTGIRWMPADSRDNQACFMHHQWGTNRRWCNHVLRTQSSDKIDGVLSGNSRHDGVWQVKSESIGWDQSETYSFVAFQFSMHLWNFSSLWHSTSLGFLTERLRLGFVKRHYLNFVRL